MSDASDFLTNTIRPALAVMDARFRSAEAEWMLTIIAGVESRWTERQQLHGPARGFWQFEKRGGLIGVMTGARTGEYARRACFAFAVSPGLDTVWDVLDQPAGDGLACCLARLLLWSDPAPLPAIGAGAAGYDYYIRNWRPGKPSRERWNATVTHCGSLRFLS